MFTDRPEVQVLETRKAAIQSFRDRHTTHSVAWTAAEGLGFICVRDVAVFALSLSCVQLDKAIHARTFTCGAAYAMLINRLYNRMSSFVRSRSLVGRVLTACLGAVGSKIHTDASMR